MPVVVVKTPLSFKTFPVQSLPHCHHVGCAKILKLNIYFLLILVRTVLDWKYLTHTVHGALIYVNPIE